MKHTVSETAIEGRHLIKEFPMGNAVTKVLRDISLQVTRGEFVSIMGPSGSGKSTLLYILGGLDTPTSGHVYLNGTDISGFDDEKMSRIRRRKIGFVFQFYNLIPNLNVEENIMLPLLLDGQKTANHQEQLSRILEVTGLTDRRRHTPRELSGGQQQRVAIARAIVSEPRLLLLDEPLSNLDAKLRVDMRSELKRLHHDTGSTIIYVTHDQVEALTMSTKIALFREGELVQVDKPLELYDNPCDLYTADFIGNPSINFVEASGTAGASGLSVDGVMGRLEFSREDMTPEAPASGDLKLVLGIRPEQITISREKTDAAQVEARVYAGMPAGSETLVSVRVGEKLITVKELGSTHYAGDETVYLSYPPKKVNVFDASTKRLIKYSR